jgi:hypothetical protein
MNGNVNDFFPLLLSDTLSICLVTWFTSIFGGFAIFTVLGNEVHCRRLVNCFIEFF